MRIKTTPRGFRMLKHPSVTRGTGEDGTLLQESSMRAPGSEPGSCEPGSSYLWVGNGQFHLDREEVSEFVEYMQHWLDNHRLPPE